MAITRPTRRQKLASSYAVLVSLVAWASCVPSRQALFDPVHAQTRERLGQSMTFSPGSARVTKEVQALLQSPLTLESATRIALLNNPSLHAVLEALGSRGAELAQASTPRNPDVEAELVFPPGSDEDPHLELHAMQDLTSWLELPGRRAIARATLDAARWRAVGAAVNLAATAQRAFYRTLAATQSLAMQKTYYEAAAVSFDLASRLHEAGNITDLALAQEQSMFEQARLDLADAEIAVSAAREELTRALGLWGEQTSWTLAGQLAEVPAAAPLLEELERAAVARSTELEALRAEGAAAARAVGLARLTSWMPELGIGVSGKREDDGWQLGPALSLSVPIFDLGQGERAAAWSRLRQTEHRYRASAAELRSAARMLWQRYEVTRKRALHLRDVVLPLRQRILEQTVLQYNAMNASPFDLLLARQQQIAASRQYLESLRDAWVGWTELQALRAGGSPAGSEMQPAGTSNASSTQTDRGH